jgi:hypothetical protein
MRKLLVAGLVVVVALSVVVGVQAFSGRHHIKGEQMTGYQETSTGTPAGLYTDGTGTFDAKIADDDQSITYELTYSGLTSNVTQAHIHFGNRYTSGGVSLFLCSNLGNGPAGTPACPPTGGTVTGTLTPASVVGPAAQGIPPGPAGWPRILAAIRAGVAYANVHTTQFPAGEIRTQLNDRDQRQAR